MSRVKTTPLRRFCGHWVRIKRHFLALELRGRLVVDQQLRLACGMGGNDAIYESALDYKHIQNCSFGAKEQFDVGIFACWPLSAPPIEI